MSGKGSNRRREDSAKVEANWPANWNAREAEKPEHPDMLRGTSGVEIPRGVFTPEPVDG